MNISDLQKLIEDARWFDNIGSAKEADACLILRSIDDWNAEAEWEWLPSSNDQIDPFHNISISDCSTHEEKEIFRETLKSLRRLPKSIKGLVSGPHDFTQAARGAAGFAARMAAREIILDYPPKWQFVMDLYGEGYWPCGRTKSDELVVL